MPIFPNRHQPLREINGSLYLVQATLPIEQFSTVSVEDMKNYLGSDVAFRVGKEGVFYFCETIPDVDYEEI